MRHDDTNFSLLVLAVKSRHKVWEQQLHLKEGFLLKELPKDATTAPHIDGRPITLLTQQQLRWPSQILVTFIFW